MQQVQIFQLIIYYVVSVSYGVIYYTTQPRTCIQEHCTNFAQIKMGSYFPHFKLVRVQPDPVLGSANNAKLFGLFACLGLFCPNVSVFALKRRVFNSSPNLAKPNIMVRALTAEICHYSVFLSKSNLKYFFDSNFN